MTFKSFFFKFNCVVKPKEPPGSRNLRDFSRAFLNFIQKNEDVEKIWFHVVKFRKNTICDIVCSCPAFISLLAHSRIICRPLFDRSDREMSLSRSTSQQVLRCGEPRRLLYSYANGNIKKVFPIGQKYRFIASNLYLPLLAFLSCM